MGLCAACKGWGQGVRVPLLYCSGKEPRFGDSPSDPTGREAKDLGWGLRQMEVLLPLPFLSYHPHSILGSTQGPHW